MFSGWWLGDGDGRFGEPFISPEEWDNRLREAGFDGCDSVTYDHAPPYHINANIIAKPAARTFQPKSITLLHGSEPHPLEREVESSLRNAGYKVDRCQWGHDPPLDQDLISFIDLSKPLLQEINESELQRFLELIGYLQQSLVLWLTTPAQINCRDPHAAQILGMARTIRAELAMPFATLELESNSKGAASAIVDVLQKIQRDREDTFDLEPDLEYAYANEVLNISRFHRTPIVEALTADSSDSIDAKEVVLGKRGFSDAPQWKGQKLYDLAPDEVQVRIVTVGINSPDILSDRHKTIVSEGAGYVEKSGSNVEKIQVGDRVMLIGTNSNGVSTVVQRPAEHCVKIPDNLSFEDAATMPIPYVTIIRSFLEKANLQKGQSVLIHSAASSIGIAALHVAQWIGVDIYATVASEDEADFLIDNFKLPRYHIFSSQDTSFLDDVLKVTDNKGVNVVLNSLSGELLRTSWKCVAADGSMLEIGKRDTAGKGQIAIDMYKDNRTFFSIDISSLVANDRRSIARLLEKTMELYSTGQIKPIFPITTYDAEKIEEAIGHIQKGTEIGNIVIKFPKEDILPLTPTISAPVFRSDVSYLLVGGLGGLGKVIASWMASNGAKTLIFLSRSAGKSYEDRKFFNELKIGGCCVQTFAGDVTDKKFVQAVVDQAAKPIGGVMQMAMVLRDLGVLDMDFESWDAAVQPKVQGTWNLHNVLPNDLDFFVLFSSYIGIMGNYGQSNYSSAGSFLDGFAQYRQSLGLPATVMDIGPVEDAGFISRTQSVLDSLSATSVRLIREEEFLEYLQLATAKPPKPHGQQRSKSSPSRIADFSYCNRGQIIHTMESSLPIMDPKNHVIWKRDPRMAIYRNIEKVVESQAGETVDGLRGFMSSVMADPRKLDQKESVELLAQEIARRISTFLMKGEDEIDISQTLSALGVDSLVAIEIRNWWKQNLGIDTSLLELMGGGSVYQLGELAAKRLRVKFSGDGD